MRGADSKNKQGETGMKKQMMNKQLRVQTQVRAGDLKKCVAQCIKSGGSEKSCNKWCALGEMR